MKELNALLSLIEDSDPIVRNELLSKFKTLGLGGREQIITYLSNTDANELIHAGEKVLGSLADYYINEQIKNYLSTKDEVEFYFLVSLAFNLYVKKSTFDLFFKNILLQCKKRMKQSHTVRQKLIVISEVLFHDLKFRNVQLEVKNVMYLDLDTVISNKKGDTLSLCLLYSYIAKSLGITLEYCTFGDYTMLRLSETDELFIDLSGNGNILSLEETKLLLKINYIRFNKLKILTSLEINKVYLEKLISFISESDLSEIINRLEFFKEELFFEL